MGVKGLQYYVEHFCPDVCKNVSIKDLADYWKYNFRTEPVLVVDGMSLLHKLYSDDLDWICGGQWWEFIDVISNFVKKFRVIGVRLVVFFDGTVCSVKRSEWIQRRVKKYADISYIFNFIKENNTKPEEKYFQLPTSMGTLTRYIFKFCCDVEVFSTCKEADQEIAEYARKNSNVFAVMSQDSDFLIYNTKSYLSTSNLNLQNMTTVLYDRERLACQLGLHVKQLPLFSCLVGNDIITREMLSGFYHHHFSHLGCRFPSSQEAIPFVASLIKQNGWWGNIQNCQELRSICQYVFSRVTNNDIYNTLYEGLKVYSSENNSGLKNEFDLLPSDLNSIMCKLHISCENLPVIYNLFHYLVYDSTEVLEDCMDRSLPPAALIYRSVRKRMYGLLLNSISSSDNNGSNTGSEKLRQPIYFKEWCAYSGNMLLNPDLVKSSPITVSGYKPTLNLLWCGGSDAQALRFDCFVACMGLKITTRMLLSIPTQYIALCSILHYLISYQPCLLEPWEVKAFIAQAVSSRAKDLKQLVRIKICHLNSRGVHLASVFMRGVVTVLAVLGACGYPFPLEKAMPWHFFDGKLFHEMYVCAKGGAPMKQLCNYNDYSVGMFRRLLDVVIAGTPMVQLVQQFG